MFGRRKDPGRGAMGGKSLKKDQSIKNQAEVQR